MKLLTCVIPCYNSAAYMRKAVDSALAGGNEMDIVIVDDGSTDETVRIADEYAACNPGLVRAVHQENGGHGEALNTGLREAEGLFFKVLDSDDRLDAAALKSMLALLRQHTSQPPDLVVHDYVYDHADREAVYGIDYATVFPQDRVITWEEAGFFPVSKQFMIHSLIYRTGLLREIGLHLPAHTFYEDNLYIYQPLPHVKRLLYHHVPLYGYLTGRGDQSVNETVILSRLGQVTEIAVQMITSYRLEELNRLPRQLKRYMINNCCGQLSTTCSLQFIQNTEESLRMNRDMWQRIRDFDPALYKALRRNPLGRATCLPGAPGRALLVFGYRLVRRHIRF